MQERIRGMLLGVSRRRAVGWACVAAVLFAVPFAYLEGGTPTFGAAIAVALIALLFGTVLPGVQAATNGGVALSWLLTAAPLLGLRVTLDPPFTAAAPLTLLVLFFGTTGHLVGTEVARERDADPRPAPRWERLGLAAVVAGTCLVFAAAYAVPLWGS